MKRFLLLRNNVETGPFTLDELTAQHLESKDLIRIEGRSTAWNHPTELELLQLAMGASIAEEKPQMRVTASIAKSIFAALPPQNKPRIAASIGTRTMKPTEQETSFSLSLADHDTYRLTQAPTRRRPAQTFSNSHNAIWVGCIVAGLLFSALLIKDILDTYNKHGAIRKPTALAAHDRSDFEAEVQEQLYQNALTTEVVPVDTVTMQPVKREPVKVNLKKLVQLEANDYRVGLLGGVKNLRMLVINKSAFILDKVRFELQYLKPNGDVLKTENLVVRAVAPKSSKGLAVPTANRGVKVAYRITGIQSHQHSNALVHL